MLIHRTASLFFGVFFFLLFAPHFSQALLSAPIMLPISTTGSGCEELGVWDDATNTCTFTEDFSPEGFPITISLDEQVNIDGNGHTLSGNGGGTGLMARNGSSVKNLTIENLSQGIAVFGNDVKITNITIENTREGVSVFGERTTIASTTIRSGETGIFVSGDSTHTRGYLHRSYRRIDH